MNPVFAVDFMTHDEHSKEPKSAIFKKPAFWITLILASILDFVGYGQDLPGYRFFGNLLFFFLVLGRAQQVFYCRRDLSSRKRYACNDEEV